MALQVWLPLSSDLTNQGLADVTITGGSSFTAVGKLSNNAYNSSSEISIPVTSMSGSKVWSFCFWGYVVSSSITADWTQIARLNDGSSNLRIEVCPSSNYNGIYCYSTHNNTGYAITTGAIISPTGGYYDQWAHFSLTCDGTTIIKYINGVRVGKCSYTGTGAITGTFVLSNSDKIYKQDVRIYDNCLSDYQVRELSKGLILHYLMKGQGGNTNLLNGSVHTKDAWTVEAGTLVNFSDDEFNGIKYTVTSANQRIYNSLSNVWTTSGNKYTVSFFAKSDTDGTTIDMSRSIADFSPTFTLTQKWKKYSGIITITSSSTTGTLSVRINQAAGTAYIANLKLELGTMDTGYMPPTNSSLYTSLGYDSTIEYDCSGYNHYGTKNGTIKLNTSTPRYITSYSFSEGGYIGVETNSINSMKIPNNVSIVLWYYPTSTDSTERYLACCYESGGIGVCWQDQKFKWQIYVEGYQVLYSSTTISLNNWHQVVSTYDNRYLKIYVDGVLDGTLDLGSNKDITYQDTTPWEIGGNPGPGSYASGNITGSMSDFRIYATALSADDIKRLYDTSASIDNSGNIYAYEFQEE